MKIKGKIISIVSCLLVIGFVFISTSLRAYAVEISDDTSFNSIVEVDSYTVEEGYIEAGKEANVSLTIRNANRNA